MKTLNRTITSITSSKIKVVGKRTCEECGEKVLIIETAKGTVSDCLNCETKQLEREMGRMVAEIEKKQHEILFERFSLIPDDLKHASFENYIPRHHTQEEALKKAKHYAERFNQLEGWNSLLLIGSYGLGKSHLAYSIANTVKDQGHNVVFIDSPSLLRKIRQTYDSHENSEQEIYNVLESADLLVLDDLGAEYVKKDKSESWAGEVLFQILSARTDKPKVITTNCSSADLKEKYGANGGRIVSRMMKGTKVVKMEGQDYRTQGWMGNSSLLL